MKLRFLLPAFFLLATAAFGESLHRDATVYARPDPAAPVLAVLASGTVPTPATAPLEPAPEGWMAVDVPGPHDVFVQNKNVGKNLDIKPGTPLRLKPDLSAPVVATMDATDKAELAGLRGSWSAYKVEKPISGFVKLPTGAVTVPAAPLASVATTGPAVSSDAGRAAMPRFFEGRFTATKNFLTYRHPYNFQLLDPNGDRFAYLDVSRLLATDKVELYLERTVVIYGTGRTINESGTKRLIEVESMHLK